jgi:hypothetical protein
MTHKHVLSLISILFAVGIACPFTSAQQDDGDATPETVSEPRQPEIFTFETAGFGFDFELFNEPVVRETTNSSIYAVSIQRRAADGLALGTDGLMSFIRLTQTIDQLADIGAIEEMQKATIDDAVKAIRNAYGDINRLKTSEASYEILGEVRQGVRIDVGYLAELGISVYVECYTFESDNGNAVGVTIKYHERDDGEVSRDVIIADQFLAGLEVLPLTPESSYTYSLGGYPIRIPVRSKIQNGRRVNQYVTEATIAYQYGSLRFQMIQTPKDANKQRIAQDQLRGYESALAMQQDRGQIEIMWDAQTTVPAGEEGDSVLSGLTHAIRMNGQEFISTMYTAVDDRLVLMANFSGSIENADALSAYAGEFFNRPLTSASTHGASDHFAGISLSRPRGLSIVQNPNRPERDFVLTSNAGHNWEPQSTSPSASDGPYTRVQLVDSNAESLDTAQAVLVRDVRDPFANDPVLDPEKGSFVLDDGRNIAFRTSRVSVLVEDATPDTLIMTSYLIEGVADEGALVVSSVASANTHAAQDLTTRALLGRFAGHEESPIDLGFGFFTPTDEITRVSRLNRTGYSNVLIAQMGDDSMTVRVRPIEKETSTDSSAQDDLRFLSSDWSAETRDFGDSAFPEDMNALQNSIVAGHEGRMHESVFDGDESGSSIRVRAIGFQYNNSYVTVVTRTHGDQSSQVMARLLDLISEN